MNTVRLRELPITDLSRGWAHLRNDGSIRRYYVSAYSYVGGQQTDDVLRKEIAKTEKIDPSEIEFEYVPQVQGKYVDGAISLNNSEIIRISSIPTFLSEMAPLNVKDALNQAKFTELVAQYDELNRPMPWHIKFAASVIFKRFAKVCKWSHMSHAMGLVKARFGLPLSWIQKFAQYYNSFYDRKFHLCVYLGINAYEEDVPLAVAKLYLEIEKLVKLNLVKGKLIDPSIVSLANVSGDMQPQYAVISYLFVPSEFQELVKDLTDFNILEGQQEIPFIKKSKTVFHPDVKINFQPDCPVVNA